MIKIKSTLSKNDKKKINSILYNLNDVFSDFYITKNNLRYYIKENLDLLYKLLSKGDKILFDENGVGSSWYTIGWGGTPKYFTDLNGTIDQSSWEQIWDNSTQGATITIIFYATDALGNPDSLSVNLKVEKPIALPKFLQNPLGILLPSLGLVVMVPLSLKVRKSKYYKSLNNKDRRKLRNVLITAGFFLSLLALYFAF